MKIGTFIKNHGSDASLAKKLKVSTAAVASWRRYEAVPRPCYLKRIHLMSHGKVTYSEVINEYLGHQK